MQIIKQELLKLARSTVYATFDLSYRYWQLSLEKEPQSSQLFLTTVEICSPSRLLHGSTNCVLYLQSTLGAKLPCELIQALLHLLDDVRSHTPIIDELLRRIYQFFEGFLKYNFKLHPAKCVNFQRVFSSVAEPFRQMKSDLIRIASI